jgi:glycosyltransferase involved in cell wall biosynthesis
VSANIAGRRAKSISIARARENFHLPPADFRSLKNVMSENPATRKLRIAQVAPLWTKVPPATYGGIELLTGLLCDELARRGHEVTLFGTGDSTTAAKLRAVCDENVLDGMAHGTVANYEYYASAAVAEALRAADDFDVIHFHTGNEWIPMGAVAWTRALFTMHTQLGVDDAWVLKKYPQVAVSAISHFQISALEKNIREKIPVVYNGCDFDAFEPSFEPGKYLVFLGRMSHDKNPLDAIRIAKKAGMPIVLAGIAQGKKEVDYFEKLIRPLINGDDVKYVGLVNHAQKNKLLREAAALLFPVQWNEPFGLVMIEAMACGTPVVARNLGSIAEVVDSDITGFHADSAEAMHELVAPALALNRQTVRAHAMSRFGFQRMVDDYEEIYTALLR